MKLKVIHQNGGSELSSSNSSSMTESS